MTGWHAEGAFDLVIIGGGLAGLSCASEAIKRGKRPLLLESAPRLGGRAASHWDREWGCYLDNGPHLLVGAYQQTLAWLQQLGVDGGLLRDKRYHFYTHKLGHHALELGQGWAAWKLLQGLAQLPEIEAKDLWRLKGLVGGVVHSHFRGGAEATVTQWLQRAGSPPALFERLWEPLCLATLNEGPGSADATLFATVLKRLFLFNIAHAHPLYPQHDLNALLIDPAKRWIEQHGGIIRTGVRLKAVEQGESAITALILHSEGKPVRWVLPQALPVVMALPVWSLGRILPQWVEEQGWTGWSASPIVAVHLDYGQPMQQSAPMVGLPGSVSQWLCQWPVEGGQQRISAAISAAYREVSWDTQRLIDTVHEEVMAQYQPISQQQRVSLSGIKPRARVIKTHRATFASWPGVNQQRPGPTTPWPNLYLAGDWTNTHLPATIEGAVLSGQQAAKQIFSAR
ncbi:hydroxysqualene dehydroxylase HpnE [Magnetococcus sp. PR-3]|uniref:hydroxysqualene dehydroxylase HpnE n=1 Tax=Magnetococcus sp. PR-3 TaxID=3120355 RepID=UPI002FCDF6A5